MERTDPIGHIVEGLAKPPAVRIQSYHRKSTIVTQCLALAQIRMTMMVTLIGALKMAILLMEKNAQETVAAKEQNAQKIVAAIINAMARSVVLKLCQLIGHIVEGLARGSAVITKNMAGTFVTQDLALTQIKTMMVTLIGARKMAIPLMEKNALVIVAAKEKNAQKIVAAIINAVAKNVVLKLCQLI